MIPGHIYIYPKESRVQQGTSPHPAKGTASHGAALLSSCWAELSWDFIFHGSAICPVVEPTKPGGELIVAAIPSMILIKLETR